MNIDPQQDYFLDTSILVYAYDSSAGLKHSLAREFVEECWENENGCLSIQVLQEFYVTVTRKIKSLLEPQTARQIIADLAHWRVHSPEASDILQAIDLRQSHQLAFWDAMVVQSAMCLGCKQLISEELAHGQTFGEVSVVNPFKEES